MWCRMQRVQAADAVAEDNGTAKVRRIKKLGYAQKRLAQMKEQYLDGQEID